MTQSTAAGSMLLAFGGSSAARAAFGPSRPFDFEVLRRRARDLAAKAYVPRRRPAPDVTRTIDYDMINKIKFRPDKAAGRDAANGYPVRFFHLHRFVQEPVKIHTLSGGTARELLFSKDLFDYGDTGMDKRLPDDAGFAGFKLMDGIDEATDWLAFQGASYFRCSGEEGQYGISARGIAANTAMETREEFPSFTEFWLDLANERDPTVTILALLEGPSLTGAYRFDTRREMGAVMDVQALLFIRNDIPRLGIAPLTSMYWYGENDRRAAHDWRPEIHDSDGLSMWNGRNERIFRPLINPRSLRVNSFLDQSPKGFGLVQRDRNFENYQDDGAFYNRRPSLWVEPKGDWGHGSVRLVEIPTEDEIHDNIVAFWQPRDPVRKGDTVNVAYRLHWRNLQPYPPREIAQVVGTRIGQGGIPGQAGRRPDTSRKFVIDFRGGRLAKIAQRFDIEPVVTASRGRVSNGYVVKVVGTDRWRALFDLSFDGSDSIDLRCFLRIGGETLTETWLYQYLPKG